MPFERLLPCGLLAALAIAALPVWALPVTPCSGQTLAQLQPTNIPDDGCGQTDLGFNGFANVSGNVGALTTSGGVASGNTITPVDLAFALPGGWMVDAGDPSDSFGFQDVSAVLTPSSRIPPASGSWYISGLALTASASVGTGPTDSVDITEAFCLGSGFSSCSTTSSNYGYIEEQFIYLGSAEMTRYTICTPGLGGCTASSAASASILFANPGYQAIGIQTSVGLQSFDSTSNQLSSFTEEFDQGDTAASGAPEPSTFVLLGSALAGLGLRQYRRWTATDD
jgi:hypothetical protein